MPAPLLIADVPWLLYRSFFALPKSIVGTDGQPVNALLGTVNAILAFSEGRLPAPELRGAVACLGAEQADYRVALYPAYHAHRDPMPAALAQQWTMAPQLLASFGWTVCDSATLEADDVMYSYARAEEEAGGSALLLTGDRDLFGAVGERVAVVELRKGGEPTEVGPEQVRERYGVDPRQVPDFIALRGDPSDGLPGAPGIGAKTAARLLATYGSLEGALSAAGADAGPGESPAGRARAGADAAGMSSRVAASLRESCDLLLVFKHIATLQRIDVQRPPDRATDFAGGARAAEQMGMNRLATRLQKLS